MQFLIENQHKLMQTNDFFAIKLVVTPQQVKQNQAVLKIHSPPPKKKHKMGRGASKINIKNGTENNTEKVAKIDVKATLKWSQNPLKINLGASKNLGRLKVFMILKHLGLYRGIWGPTYCILHLFITFFDNNISQWDLLYNESKYTPPGRWKPIYNLINDRLYVLGGRSGVAGSGDLDESFSDVFYFDFIEKEFVNVGKLNPNIQTSYSLFSAPKIEDNILILNNSHLIKIDFKNLTFTNYSRGKAFSGVDNKYPTFINNQNLFYISGVNGEKFLNIFDISVLFLIVFDHFV